MPTYDYGCEACGAQWELQQRITEDAVKKCPKCKKMKARRLISGGNFILKGSGWYADLYHKPKASSSKKSESKDSSDGGSSKGSESKSSESKSSDSGSSSSSKKAANE